MSGGCKAFPFAEGGIPEEIHLTNKHDKPLKGQKNDLVFTPSKEKDPGSVR